MSLNFRDSLEDTNYAIAAYVQIPAVNILLDSHAGGAIYWSVHPLRTFELFSNSGEKSLNAKRRQL